ncbi:hypothetical protein BT69DRAFT_1296488 [Atractiella rhizophila]|nr:hypothetical protein BT69DRAFT_1296488 [Atractiella rhizophila]
MPDACHGRPSQSHCPSVRYSTQGSPRPDSNQPRKLLSGACETWSLSPPRRPASSRTTNGTLGFNPASFRDDNQATKGTLGFNPSSFRNEIQAESLPPGCLGYNPTFVRNKIPATSLPLRHPGYDPDAIRNRIPPTSSPPRRLLLFLRDGTVPSVKFGWGTELGSGPGSDAAAKLSREVGMSLNANSLKHARFIVRAPSSLPVAKWALRVAGWLQRAKCLPVAKGQVWFSDGLQLAREQMCERANSRDNKLVREQTRETANSGGSKLPR